MSTLPDFTGPGFFAGEAPDGLTTVAGTPTSASVRVYWRDPADSQAPGALVASTQSAADGTWQIAGLNPALRYVVRAQKSQFDDVTVVGAAPSRSDVIAYVDQLVPHEDEFGYVDGLTGYVLLDSGLRPFTCEVIQPLPYGLSARIEGRKLLIEGASEDVGDWESVVRVTASNGVWVDVLVVVQIQVPSDPHFDKVSLLLHMDGADGSTGFVDSGPKSLALTPTGGVKIDAEKAKWGQSARFSALGGITTEPSEALGFGSGDYTIEAWVYTNSASGFGCFFDNRLSGAIGVAVYIGNSGRAFAIANNNDVIAYSSLQAPLGSWYHLAVTRHSGITRGFVNGVLAATVSDARAFPSTAAARVGLSNVGAQGFTGYIDDLRVTKGVARYTANFTPPDKPFPNQ